MPRDKIEMYRKLVSGCERFELKGKSMLYTSANGYMFSQLNKNGELGIRFSKETQEKYIQELGTDYFTSYGAVMKGYVLMPESLWDDPQKLTSLLNESYNYVMTLQPK